jgi:ABC-type transporter Mla maintaining outer membrane lipid asymmetry ATPase subunit MlaF
MSDDNDTLVEIANLKFAYGEREILKGVNLKILRGKVVAILGTSGAGKTTLLRMVGGSCPGRRRPLSHAPPDGNDVSDGRPVHGHERL